MTCATYRNISFATAGSLDEILRNGADVEVDGNSTKELRNRVTTLEHPQERCLFLVDRNHDTVAQLAETFWVLAGRDDIGWLTHYLSRAPQFSDDGKVWRGGYGPRLRNWHGVDQIDAVRQLLIEDAATRRAVMTLYDPARDFVKSRDIPCNNWLSWLVRDGRLHLSIAIRSNDVVWGFSAINAFEWSVLQEMMAAWVGADVGEVTYFASSLHLYKRHYDRAERIVTNFKGVVPYDFGIEAPRFSTSWASFDTALDDWFRAEEMLRLSPGATVHLDDPFLDGTLRIVRLKWGEPHWSNSQLKTELAELPEDDLSVAAYEHVGRARPEVLSDIPQPKIASFFEAYRMGAS